MTMHLIFLFKNVHGCLDAQLELTEENLLLMVRIQIDGKSSNLCKTFNIGLQSWVPELFMRNFPFFIGYFYYST